MIALPQFILAMPCSTVASFAIMAMPLARMRVPLPKRVRPGGKNPLSTRSWTGLFVVPSRPDGSENVTGF